MSTLDEHPVYEVGAFYEMLSAHLEASFGRRHPHWVRGEITKVFEKGHVYLDLVDAGSAESDARRPVLNAHCWRTPWGPLKRRLADEGVVLAPGMVVSLSGYVDVYAPQGRLGFSVVDVDLEGLLGDVARRRREVIARLRDEGILGANAAREVSVVPLRVGLVASPGTEGFRDFTGQLLASGFAFEVTLVATSVQGADAPAHVVRALERLDAEGLDVLCVVRGGGSRADLACFDDESVARAIAACQTPVFTGIGHTGDESIADLVAHTHAITPTKLGEELVSAVRDWRHVHVVERSRRLNVAARDVLDEAVAFHGERRRTMIHLVRGRLRAERRRLASTAARLSLQSTHVVERAAQLLDGRRSLLGAYDPARRLSQGWSIVTNEFGRVITTLDDVALESNVAVRVADGSFGARVTQKGGVS